MNAIMFRNIRVTVTFHIFLLLFLARISHTAETQKASLVFVKEFVAQSSKEGTRKIWKIKTNGTGIREINPQESGVWQSCCYRELAFSPDGTFLSFRQGSKGIWIMQRGAQKMTVLLQDTITQHSLWSPNGDQIAYVQISPKPDYHSEYRLCSIHVKTKEIVCSEIFQDTNIDELLWSLDGDSILFTTKKYSEQKKYFHQFNLHLKEVIELDEKDPSLSFPSWLENGKMRCAIDQTIQPLIDKINYNLSYRYVSADLSKSYFVKNNNLRISVMA